MISHFPFPIADCRLPIADFRFPESRFLISVFGNRKIPAINFRVLIHEIQKTDWPQSFLIIEDQTLLCLEREGTPSCGDFKVFNAKLLMNFFLETKITQEIHRQEGSTPIYNQYWYVPPHRVGFFRRFGLKMGFHFACSGLESGVVFERTTGVYERIYHFNFK